MYKIVCLKICILVLAFSNVIAQKNILVLSKLNSPQVDNLKSSVFIQAAKNQGFTIDFLVKENKLDFNFLTKYNALILYDFDVNALTSIENNAILAYFKTGGGLVGIHDIFVDSPQFIWFNRIFETKLNNTLPSKVLDIVTLLNLNKIELPPLWNLYDSVVELGPLAKTKKVVMMDLANKPLAWLFNTEFGNKCFYTSLGGQKSVFQDFNFVNHILSGIKEVANTKIVVTDSILKNVILPSDKSFKVYAIVDNLKNASVAKPINNDNLLIYSDDGLLRKYTLLSKELTFIGQFNELKNASSFTVDPDFVNNGYVYFYFKIQNSPDFMVKRMKLNEKDAIFNTDFESKSSNFIQNILDFKFQPNNDSLGFGLPQYYDGKTFRLDTTTNSLNIETFNSDGQLLSLEPFVLNIDSLKSFSFNKYGELLALKSNNLMLVKFNIQNQFPPVANFKYEISNSNFPQKITFTVIDGLTANQYLWTINNKPYFGNKVEVNFIKPGNYSVALKVKSENGLIDIIEKVIKVEKKSTIKK
jgi:hypothetical protein